MGRKDLRCSLMKIDYPTTRLDAALDWGVPVKLSYQRLYQAVERGWLMKEGKYYSPSEEMLQFWAAYDDM